MIFGNLCNVQTDSNIAVVITLLCAVFLQDMQNHGPPQFPTLCRFQKSLAFSLFHPGSVLLTIYTRSLERLFPALPQAIMPSMCPVGIKFSKAMYSNSLFLIVSKSVLLSASQRILEFRVRRRKRRRSYTMTLVTVLHLG